MVRLTDKTTGAVFFIVADRLEYVFPLFDHSMNYTVTYRVIGSTVTMQSGQIFEVNEKPESIVREIELQRAAVLADERHCYE